MSEEQYNGPALHEWKPGPDGRCTGGWTNSRYQWVPCNSTQSHSTLHEPIDGCCYCQHGVYRHTSYDIPCWRCEAGVDDDVEPDDGWRREPNYSPLDQ